MEKKVISRKVTIKKAEGRPDGFPSVFIFISSISLPPLILTQIFLDRRNERLTITLGFIASNT